MKSCGKYKTDGSRHLWEEGVFEAWESSEKKIAKQQREYRPTASNGSRGRIDKTYRKNG
jgi:hypothetical protein